MNARPISLAGSALIAAIGAATLASLPTPASADTPAVVATGNVATTAAASPAATTVAMVGGARTEVPYPIVTLSAGTGRLIGLPRPMTGMFIADPSVADVQVKGASQLYLFAKKPGETSVYATDRSGAVIWSSTVRVGANLADVGSMLAMAMPEAAIVATPMHGMILLTGTVLAPADIEEAQRLTEQFTAGAQVLNRLKTALPMQVNLRVKIAEVSRSVTKEIGVNLLNRDGGAFSFGLSQGTAGTITSNAAGNTVYSFNKGSGTTLGAAGRLLGMDLLSTIDLYESQGLASTLAEPNLTALSGETASFLAGGEIPIPQSQGLGTVSVEFKQYGVSLAFTPFVLSGGRISLRVRPEVSQLSQADGVKLNGFTIPAIITRRADTTVELGSGQSFMIGGLLQNNHNNTISKAPFLGDLPIIGALFRSNGFRRNETELVIIVTPYLVKPVSAERIALPTDGYKAPTVAERLLLGRTYSGTSGAERPKPQDADAPTPSATPEGARP